MFETLFSAEDAIISDELNHASIIDGIRLSKARRLRYRNRDMADLEVQLQAASDARFRVIVTDGVFSMDGYIAPLAEICDLADRYDALVFVDDSHAVGFVGENGRGTPELCGVGDRVDIYTGTFGKALGEHPAAMSPRTPTSSRCFASVRARICSRTRSPPPSSPELSPHSTSSRGRPTFVRACGTTPLCSASG